MVFTFLLKNIKHKCLKPRGFHQCVDSCIHSHLKHWLNSGVFNHVIKNTGIELDHLEGTGMGHPLQQNNLQYELYEHKELQLEMCIA